jgi:ABC-type spermidine/putrescine transport system permease subunit II
VTPEINAICSILVLLVSIAVVFASLSAKKEAARG